LQTVCVRYEPADVVEAELDAFTLAWVRRINSSGAAFCSPSILDGRWMVRVSVGVEGTERSDLEFLWALFQAEVAAPRTNG
jgi:aromatic-L-amino-acid/L-tryptophan decarboxylase